MKSACFIASLCLLVVDILAVPRYGVRSWGLEEGLPSSRIVAIDQAADGRLWMATSRGLSAFDGIEFYNFNHVSNPEFGASDLTTVVISPLGWIWFADRSGAVGYFDGSEFHSVETAHLGSDDYVTCLVVNEAGLVIGGTRDGGLLELYPNQPSLIRRSSQWFERTRPGSPGLQMLFDEAGQLWAGLHTELNIWSPNGLIPVLPELHVDTSENQPWVWALGNSPREGVWVAADLQLRRYSNGQWIEARGEFPWGFEKGISAILEARDGRLWVASNGGGLRGLSVSEDAVFFAEDDGLPTSDVLTLFEDRESNLWLGTDGAGLVRVRPELFESFTPASGLEENLRLLDVHVNSIVEDSTHDLWLATAGQGLLHWAGDGLSSLYGIGKPTATVLVHDSKRRVWVGTLENGLDVFLPRSDSQTEFEVEPVEAFDGLTIVSVFEDSSQNIWVATEQNLVRLLDGRIQIQPSSPLGEIGNVRCIMEDAEGRMWFGTSDRGVFQWFDDVSRQFSRKDGLPDESVTAMCLDDEGKLWIGTYGGGIACFAGGRFEAISQSDRLADGFITGMINDQKGALWLGTGRGVSRIAWEDLNRSLKNANGRVREMNFGREDGLSFLECSDGYHPSMLRSEKGHLYFPLKKGVAQLSAAQLVNASEWIPPVTIRRVEVDGRAAAMELHEGINELIVPPETRRIDVRFSGVGLSAPEKVVYRYRLSEDGESRDWNSIGSQRSISFLELEPGEYRLELTASLQGGPWNPKSAVLNLRIRPNWWETRLAAIAGLLSVAGFIGFVSWAYAIRRIREEGSKRELERAVVKERERIAQDMHDDLGARLTQLSLQGELLKRSLDEPQSANDSLEKVVAGVRQTAQALDDIVWMTNPRNDQLDRLISHLAQLASETAELLGWELALSLPDSIPERMVEGRARHEIVMAVKEVINNASKHSGCRLIRFDVRLDSELLHINITDDGCGFDVGQSGEKGNGLYQLERRIKSIGGELKVASKEGSGTKVEIAVGLNAITK